MTAKAPEATAAEAVPPNQGALRQGALLAAGYRVDEHLARGADLDVYAVWSTERDCPCVAKTLRPDRTGDNAARYRLLAEGRLLHRLDHPNLVRGYGTCESPRAVAITEILSGETLGHLVGRRRQGLAADDLAQLGLQVCSVLAYLHRSGTLHLDLKPSNIVAEAGRARVLDLSHARPPGPCPAGFGTWEYMAPEQVRGEPVSAATDVFGLGGVLYRAATRRRPYSPDGRVRHPEQPVAMGPLRRRRLPRSLIALVEDCLRTEPADRPTVADCATILSRLVQAREVQPRR